MIAWFIEHQKVIHLGIALFSVHCFNMQQVSHSGLQSGTPASPLAWNTGNLYKTLFYMTDCSFINVLWMFPHVWHWAFFSDLTTFSLLISKLYTARSRRSSFSDFTRNIFELNYIKLNVTKLSVSSTERCPCLTTWPPSLMRLAGGRHGRLRRPIGQCILITDHRSGRWEDLQIQTRDLI